MEQDEAASSATAERRGDVVGSASKGRSPSPARSSPFSSNFSEPELDVFSLSRHSSCSSLNQQSAGMSSAVCGGRGGLPLRVSTGVSHAAVEKAACGVDERPDGNSLMRSAPRDPDSDDDTMDEDSNCSSNEVSNSSFNGSFSSSRRKSDVAWRSPTENEGGRKLSLTNVMFHAVSSDSGVYVSSAASAKPLHTEVATPSPNTSGRSSPVASLARAAPRSRVANIRRESHCSVESEAAHEKLVKTAQQVSVGFDEFCIADGERKRTHSLSEPISILTNAFLPHSSSPSPTRAVDIQKQCYSPSTQQIVRNNITYSPSPSPTPSPTRRIMRSLSPIAVRQIVKRRYTASAGVDSDGEAPSPGVSAQKRSCLQPSTLFSNGGKGGASPLANERYVPYAFPSIDAASVPSTLERLSGGPFCTPFPPYRMLLDPAIERQRLPPLTSPVDSDECASAAGDEESCSTDCLLPSSPSLSKDESRSADTSLSDSNKEYSSDGGAEKTTNGDVDVSEKEDVKPNEDTG